MGALEVSRLAWTRPGAQLLFRDVSFRVGDRQNVALVGDNGVGKTTLLRLIAGDLDGAEGVIRIDGRLGVMRQFVGSPSTRERSATCSSPCRPPDVVPRRAARLAEVDPADGIAYAHALAAVGRRRRVRRRGPVGHVPPSPPCDLPLEAVAGRPVTTLSGGEQKRLALEVLLRGDADVLLLDEPDNYLDVPGKQWLEQALRTSPEDDPLRQPRPGAAGRRWPARSSPSRARGAWTHGGGFATWHQARARPPARDSTTSTGGIRPSASASSRSMQEFSRRSASSDKFASRARATQTSCATSTRRGRRPSSPRTSASPSVWRAGAPASGRCGSRRWSLPASSNPSTSRSGSASASACSGATAPARATSCSCWPASPSTTPAPGRSALASSRATSPRPTTIPSCRTGGARHPPRRRTSPRLRAMAPLGRYELRRRADQAFRHPVGRPAGPAADPAAGAGRRQRCCCSTSRPTTSTSRRPKRWRTALDAFEGTVLAVTHDRWLMRTFDRFLVFGADGTVIEALEPVYA